MEIHNIDPFLYRSYKIPFPQKVSPQKDQGFFTKPQVPEALRHKIASSAFSLTPSRKEVLEHIGEDPERRKLYEAAEQFEALFVERMFREMKKNVGRERLIHGGFAEEIFDEMLLTERVTQLAYHQELGLAEKIYAQLANVTAARQRST
ncbi:MAG: rod-binding protein [Leptospiraceae bacterium]|nr:rod-binding protein [Leptospiraceae bacterium]MDW8307592.1 rod-binding protein [Leptospiraceae bacterium]